MWMRRRALAIRKQANWKLKFWNFMSEKE